MALQNEKSNNREKSLERHFLDAQNSNYVV